MKPREFGLQPLTERGGDKGGERGGGRETEATLEEAEGGEREGDGQGRDVRFQVEKVERGGSKATRDDPTARVVEGDERAEVGSGSERGPGRGGIANEATKEGAVEDGEGLLIRAPRGGGNGFERAKAREEARSDGGGVGSEGESAVKGDAKEAGRGIERESGVANRERRAESGLPRIAGEEGDLALVRVKRKKPLLRPVIDTGECLLDDGSGTRYG